MDFLSFLEFQQSCMWSQSHIFFSFIAPRLSASSGRMLQWLNCCFLEMRNIIITYIENALIQSPSEYMYLLDTVIMKLVCHLNIDQMSYWCFKNNVSHLSSSTWHSPTTGNRDTEIVYICCFTKQLICKNSISLFASS